MIYGRASSHEPPKGHGRAGKEPAPTPAPPRILLAYLRYRSLEIGVWMGIPILGALFAWPQGATDSLGRLLAGAAATGLLVWHILCLNDWAGLVVDPTEIHRVLPRTVADRDQAPLDPGIPRTVQATAWGLLGAALLLFGGLGWPLLLLALGLAGLSLAYSHPRLHAKRLPALSTAIHLAAGTIKFLLGYALLRPVDPSGLLAGVFFACIFAAGHFFHELTDLPQDAAAAVATHPVRFGADRMAWVGWSVFLATYPLLFWLNREGVLPLPLALVAGAILPLHLAFAVSLLRHGLRPAALRWYRRGYRVGYGLLVAAMLWLRWRQAGGGG